MLGKRLTRSSVRSKIPVSNYSTIGFTENEDNYNSENVSIDPYLPVDNEDEDNYGRSSSNSPRKTVRTPRSTRKAAASKIMMEENDPLPPEEIHTTSDAVLYDDRGPSRSSALTTLPTATNTVDYATSPLFSKSLASSNSDLNLVHSHLTEEEQFQCRKAAEQYISNCKRYHVPVDPAVVIALETGWKVLQPTRRFTEGSMLPLKNILEDDKVVKKLNLSNVGMQDARFRFAGNGNANARVLNFILQHNSWIEELDLSNTGLDDDGVKEISQGLENNQSIKKLNLSSNHFGEDGASYLGKALARNTSVTEVDLSRNALGFSSIYSILCICNPKKMNVITHGNYVFEEILNSVTHGIGFLGAVIGANILISDATDTYHTDYHFWACVLYSFA